MGTIASKQTSISDALFGQTRMAVLTLFFSRPDEYFHTRQIVRQIGKGVGTVQRELARLTGAGILKRATRANMALYQADPKCPIFDELKSLVIKTFGVADVLRDALATLSEKIPIAFIFGSFARGEHRESSDIDLLIVADAIKFPDLVKALRSSQERLGREVNPTLYGSVEFAVKLFEKHHFLSAVMKAPKIFLVGDTDELKRLGTLG